MKKSNRYSVTQQVEDINTYLVLLEDGRNKLYVNADDMYLEKKKFMMHIAEALDFYEDKKNEEMEKMTGTDWLNKWSEEKTELDFYPIGETNSQTFGLNDLEFTVEEDESDGYRSYLGPITSKKIDPKHQRMIFDRVRVEAFETSTDSGFRIVSCSDSVTWLEFGTNNYDDYYPNFYYTDSFEKNTKPIQSPVVPSEGLTIEVFQEDWMPGFAAFADNGSVKSDAKAHVAINLGSILFAKEIGDLDRADLPYMIAESIMHEVIHALEAWAEVEFSEDRVEALLDKYRKHVQNKEATV